jgi:hypothetical protein
VSIVGGKTDPHKTDWTASAMPMTQLGRC